MAKLKFSICIPVCNGEKVLGETLRSILSQSFEDYEIIIVDDRSEDKTEEVVRGFKDKRIKFFKNEKNLGYSGNLEECRKKANGEIIYLMGQDDILAKDALEKTYQAFLFSKDIGAVTRPYFWFYDRVEKPVRIKKRLSEKKDLIMTLNSPLPEIITMFSTLDQLSGLAFRKKYLDTPFHPDIFPSHVYPFAAIFKKHPVVFLKDYLVAVRITSSQSRKVSKIYEKSPLRSWVEMFETVFPEEQYRNFRKRMIKEFVATNFVGLLQIKNYSRRPYFYTLREIYYLLKYRRENVLSPLFWLLSVFTLATPKSILIPLVDWYKDYVYARTIPNLNFQYQLK